MSISGVLSASVSGLSLSSQRVAVAADNIANVSTIGYKAREIVASSVVTRQSASGSYASGGVGAVLRTPLDAQGSVEASNVDLARQFIGLIGAVAAYESNLEVLKTGDALLKQLIDIKA